MSKENLKICYIGGGSRNWAWVLMQDLAFEKDIRGTIELFDINHNDALVNEKIGNKLMEKHNFDRWKFHANSSLSDALIDSDFIFISILPGDFEEMAIDVHLPEKYGIYQPVGDSAGPGGIIRAIRTIPQYRHIAREIQKYAPDAWVINYTNPMSVCTRTLYKEFPGIKAFGCCHEVFNTQHLLASVVEKAGFADEGSIRREEIKVNVLGINHFTWIDKASWKDVDIFPVYMEFADENADTGFLRTPPPGIDADEIERFRLFKSAERVKMDLFQRYGLIAAAGDRHLAEFCPPDWYLSSPEAVKNWGYTMTPVSWRIKDREKLKQKAASYSEGTQLMTPVLSEEEGIKIVKALIGLGDLVTNVNYPNRGQIPDLPADAVVETNAVFSRDSISPVVTDGFPADVRALIMHHLLTQEGIVEAVYENDMDKAFRIFSLDYAVQKLPLSDAGALFDEMCSKTLN
ncbi:MAG: alpha-glucosidase/alpha-galactosidase [Treponema sp.]|nr:alpha-glucosidase/alpha-galactosidase [Treponema sp.]